MKKFTKLTTLLAIMMISVAGALAQKPNVYILATGGTIAGTGASATGSGYTAGQVAIASLIEAVPEISNIANVKGEQIVSIGSQDMTDEVWLTLANRINELLATDEVDAIVITHGTDTMEETGYFLNLTVHSDKPVILTGSMRPSTAISADGPLNLYNAVCAAADPKSKGKGVMLAMNGLLLGAHSAIKMNTVDVQTFQAPNSGALGYIIGGKVTFNDVTLKKHTTESEFDVTGLKQLPKVGIMYSYSNVDADVATPFLNNGYAGVVLAGVGNGNYHKNTFPQLLEARKKGILVVRSSRVPTGPVILNDEVDDAKYTFVASEELNPQKSRVLLMLALTKTSDWKQIQKYFEEY